VKHRDIIIIVVGCSNSPKKSPGQYRDKVTTAAGFKPRSGHVGFVVDKVALGAGLLRALRFPLTILIPPTAPHSSSTIRGWYNRPISG
jgi:hypothetical protein